MNFMKNINKLRKLAHAVLLLVFMFSSTLIFAQGKKVSGVVNNALDISLPGVSVVEKGTTNGTSTDIDGKFSLQVGAKAQLIVSFIGFKSQAVNVEGKTNLIITLEEDMQQLDQVVVVGYGKKNIKDVTGAIVFC